MLRADGGRTSRHGPLRHAIDGVTNALKNASAICLIAVWCFVGTRSLDATLAIAGGQAAGATLNGLQSLVQKSLVIAERATGGLRYRATDSVRAPACAPASRIVPSEVVCCMRKYHARLARLREQCARTTRLCWMDHLDSESNLRAAWEWLQVRPARRAEGLEPGPGCAG